MVTTASARSALRPRPPAAPGCWSRPDWRHGLKRVSCAAALAVGVLASGRLIGGEAGPGPRPIVNCEVQTPQGDYALVTLEFANPADARKGAAAWTYVGGMRGGRMRMDDGLGLREPGGWLELKDGKLTGIFRRCNGTYWNRQGMFQVAVEATVKDGIIAGTARFGDQAGTVSGRVVPEADLAKRNPIPKDKGWPSYLGAPGSGCAAQPTGVAMMASASAARVVWRCEESDIGQGLSPLTRFMDGWGDASTLRTSSGAASPIAADGRIFVKYHVPCPKDPNPAAAKVLEEAARKAGLGELPEYAREKIYNTTDDIVVCMDAASGKTLWKSVVKDRGLNKQHHKAGPFDMTPGYGDGKVFALGMSGFLYAFDGATGKPLWEVPYSQSRDLPAILANSSYAILVVGKVVVGPSDGVWAGFDTETGKLLWKSGPASHTILTRWTSGTREFLVGMMGKSVVCIDALTGKEAWQLPIQVYSGGRGLGPGGMVVHEDKLILYRNDGAGKDVKPSVAAYQLTPGKADLLWEVAGGCQGESVPVVVAKKFVFTADLRVIDLATGKVLGQGKGPVPSNGGFMQACEDLVLVRIDGTHGKIGCAFYKVAADGTVTNITGAESWSPSIGHGTTSYHHPIMYPFVDGRVFMRQYDGVYCWDLRAGG